MGYFPAINDSPKSLSVIQYIIDRTIECMNYLNLLYIFLEVHQAIFNKVLQVLFAFQEKENRKFAKIIVHMGGFHVILYLLRTTYFCFNSLMPGGNKKVTHT